MGATDSQGRPFRPAELDAQKAGLQRLQFRLLHEEPLALSVSFLQEAHRELSGGVEKLHPGELRTGEITFGSFYGTRPSLIEGELAALITTHQQQWLRCVAEQQVTPHAIWVHAELIRIHPMSDGNGRLARALESWLCWQGGEQAVIYPDRQRYHAGIARYCHRGDLSLLLQAATVLE
ncbi:hypothetical protein Dxin01_03340 [Deinococcus xinjiangensis]|uniref:Fido domain-containing protein n=1 Tax=Deinococcus xinjiangensis TaxID=457454 RepID=A0ABP9VEB4_9DEIO